MPVDGGKLVGHLIDDVGGSVVAAPDVIGRVIVETDVLHVRASSCEFLLNAGVEILRGIDAGGLEARGGGDDFCEAGLDERKLVRRPGIGAVRPGEPDGVLRCPFCGPVVTLHTDGRESLVEEALGDGCVGVDTAVAEEGPDAAVVFEGLEVDIVVEDGLVVDRGDIDYLSIVVGDEGLTPELGFTFGADAVDGADVAAVGDGVTAHHGLPGIVLGLSECGIAAGQVLFFRQPADGGWVDENFCSFERSDAGRPLGTIGPSR